MKLPFLPSIRRTLPRQILFGPLLFAGVPLAALAGQQAHDLHGFGGWMARSIGFAFGTEDFSVFAADADGDGLDDLVFFTTDPSLGDADSDVYVARNTGDGFTMAIKWHDWFCIGREVPLTGDFDGDGREDIACLLRSEYSGTPQGDVYVALSTGAGFGTSSKWHDWFCIGQQIPLSGDFNGDGKDDLVCFTADASADVYVTLSNGSGFVGSGTAARWHADFCTTGSLPKVGDFNGDGMDDIACFIRGSQGGPATGDVLVALSNGSSFGPAEVWHDYFCDGNETPRVGDFNGDGSDDILTILPGGGKYVAFSRGTRFQNAGLLWHRASATGSPVTGRFNRDANTDLAKVRYSAPMGIKWFSASVALAGGLSTPSTTSPAVFGAGTRYNGGPALGTQPLLVLLLEGPATDGRIAFSHTNAYYDSLVFGAGHPSIRNFYTEMSGGKFTWSRKGVIGPVADPNPPSADRKTAAPQIAADHGFNFDACDVNGDHIVDNSELAILLIDNYTTGSGQTSERWVTVNKPGGGTIEVRCMVAAAGHRAVFDIYAHELAHCIDTLDLYGLTGNCAFNVSLMGAIVNKNANYYDWPRVDYLDVWHRMALGWIEPEIHDIRSGPGAALVDAAQASTSMTDRRPILLYDSARGTDEFYLIEYRTGAFPDGTRICDAGDPAAHFADEWLKGYSGTNFAPAGYDTWFNHGYGGPGVAVWYVHLDPDKSLAHDKRRILPGNNGVLDSVASGDDVYAEFNGVDVIEPGPNNRIDSPQLGDDGKQGDFLCLLSLTPGVNDRQTRGVQFTNVYHHSHGPLDVEWFDETPVDLDLRIGEETGRTASLGWGKFNQPFLESISTKVMWPGSSPARLQLRAGGHIRPRIVLYSPEQDRGYPVTTSGWDSGGCTIDVPTNVPGGRYLLQSQVTEGTTVRVSNSLPLTISDPYDLWAMFAIRTSFQRRPTDDPDGDGWDNFDEYAMGTDPESPGDPGGRVSYGIEHVPPSGDMRFFMRWPMAGGSPIVDFRLESSWDLKTWQPVTLLMSIPDPDPSFNWLKGAVTPGPTHDHGFFRLEFIKLNEP